MIPSPLSPSLKDGIISSFGTNYTTKYLYICCIMNIYPNQSVTPLMPCLLKLCGQDFGGGRVHSDGYAHVGVDLNFYQR